LIQIVLAVFAAVTRAPISAIFLPREK